MGEHPIFIGVDLAQPGTDCTVCHPAGLSSTKRCSKCKGEFPRDDQHFHQNKRSKDGLNGYCKPCQCKYVKDHAEEKRRRHAARAAAGVSIS